MILLRKALAATAVTLSLAAPAFAQQTSFTHGISMELSDHQALAIDPAGRVTKITVTDYGHRMMMRYAHPVKAGIIFHTSGGKLYMAFDRPMHGRMLADQLGN